MLFIIGRVLRRRRRRLLWGAYKNVFFIANQINVIYTRRHTSAAHKMQMSKQEFKNRDQINSQFLIMGLVLSARTHTIHSVSCCYILFLSFLE